MLRQEPTRTPGDIRSGSRTKTLLGTVLIAGLLLVAGLMFNDPLGPTPDSAAIAAPRELLGAAPPQPAPLAFTEGSLGWRIGVGCAREQGYVDEYDVGRLCAGWYHDWGLLKYPARPNDMEFIQTVRVGPDRFNLNLPNTYDWSGLAAKVVKNLGSVWTIGNEPDGRAPGACDKRTPDEYAQVYKLFYDHIKSVDPTAKISNGPIIQGTPLRIQYLTMVWDAYRSRYGSDWPVDVWNMHNQMVKEKPSEGADIPLGLDAYVGIGRNYGVQDNDNLDLFIEHVVRMREWMKQRGQKAKPLIISEYGVIQPEYEGFTVDRINEYMDATFTYLLYARDVSLGMPGDDYHLVQRWAWFSLNAAQGTLGQGGGWNGNLFDPETGEITENGRNFANWVCAPAQPTPTPSSQPKPGTIRREAEGGSAHGLVVKRETKSASSCRYVTIPQQGAAALAADLQAEETDVTYHVFAPNTDQYSVWLRGYGTDWNNYAYGVRVGDYPEQVVRFGFDNWNWRKVDLAYQLPGNSWNKIVVGPRGSGGALLDLLVVTSDDNYRPASDPSVITKCTPPVTPTPVPTATTTPTRTATPKPTPTRTAMPAGPGQLLGSVEYQGRGGPSAAWETDLLVSAHLPDDPIPAYLFEVLSTQSGNFSVPRGILPGTYDIGVRNLHSLRNLRKGVAVSADTPAMDMGLLLEGDSNIDNSVGVSDLALLASSYGQVLGEAGYDRRADLNDDGEVGVGDLALLASNYGEKGDRVLSGAGAPAADHNGAPAAGPVSVRIQPASSTKQVGDEWDVRVYLDAGSNPVRAADLGIEFDPSVLEALYADPNTGPPGTPPFLDVLGGAGVSGKKIFYAAGTSGDPKTGTVLLFTVRLKATSVSPLSELRFTGWTTVTAVYVDAYDVVHNLATSNGSVTVLGPTTTPTNTVTPTPSRTPTITPTGLHTPVPWPTATNTPETGVEEIVLRQNVEGYKGFVDTYLSSWHGDTNYHTEADLRLYSPDTKQIMIRADLEGILPPGTIIEEATLTLYELYSSGRRLMVDVYEVIRPWVGEEATWFDATDSETWDLVGCQRPGVDRAATWTFQREVFPTTGTFEAYPFDFDVTSLVQMWVDAPESNMGLVMASDNSISAEATFGSADYPSYERRPKLTIRFRRVVETPTATPTEVATLTPTRVTGLIEGTVFEDRNGNQRMDAGEPGLAGGTLECRVYASGLLVGTIHSVVGGSYEFPGLAPDTYQVSMVSPPAGYRATGPAWVVPVGAGERRTADFPVEPAGRTVSIPLILKNAQ